MKILIIDQNSVNQAMYAEKLNLLSPADVETLDLHVMLVDARNYDEHLAIMDLVILGSGLGDKTLSISRRIREAYPNKHIVAFTSNSNYQSSIVKQAHYCGIRKVLSDSGNTLDFLQELYSIDAEYRRNGDLSYAEVIVVTSPKGGAGVTSLTAGMAEAVSNAGKKNLLWDLDYTTQDLSRSLSLFGHSTDIYADWLSGKDPSLKDLIESITKVDANTDLLVPPEIEQISFDLLYHNDGSAVLHKILELARYQYDQILIDLPSPHTPGGNTILSQADTILVMTGECALSVTACELFLEKLNILNGSLDNVKIVCTGDRFSSTDIQKALSDSKNYKIENNNFSLPPLAGDNKAYNWPGSGKTLYSMGSDITRRTLDNFIQLLKIAPLKTNSENQSKQAKIINIQLGSKQKKLALENHGESKDGIRKGSNT